MSFICLRREMSRGTKQLLERLLSSKYLNTLSMIAHAPVAPRRNASMPSQSPQRQGVLVALTISQGALSRNILGHSNGLFLTIFLCDRWVFVHKFQPEFVHSFKPMHRLSFLILRQELWMPHLYLIVLVW